MLKSSLISLNASVQFQACQLGLKLSLVPMDGLGIFVMRLSAAVLRRPLILLPLMVGMEVLVQLRCHSWIMLAYH